MNSPKEPLKESLRTLGTELITQTSVRLTQYSHGAGCGCKIAPNVLEEILKTSITIPGNKNLLVGNDSKDDAAVYDLENGMAIISTTDFFMPVVDDAFDFGRIAAANSISDVYAMGGKPLLAIAVLGWPVEKIPVELAQKVIDGGRTVCNEAGISLAGGHSIDSPEPIFGLAVTGIINKENLKKNNTAEEGDLIFLTKPLGVGILSTAQKRNLLTEDNLQIMVKQMTTLNKVGEELGKIKGVTAMTDVTGFGLLGHLIELAEGSNLSAEIFYNKIPIVDGVKDFIKRRIFPDATTRNWNSYHNKVKFEKPRPDDPVGRGLDVMEAFTLLPDPQTNGGLLFSVKEAAKQEVVRLLEKSGLQDFVEPIGRFISKEEKMIEVKNK
ncbi:MAG TPA: selenide, water dikinase SelD [Chitinophagaceae bacterium]